MLLLIYSGYENYRLLINITGWLSLLNHLNGLALGSADDVDALLHAAELNAIDAEDLCLAIECGVGNIVDTYCCIALAIDAHVVVLSVAA